jgi:uroporphyrinogen decarboxylase
MTSLRENLVRTLRRNGFDRVPIDLDLCPSQVEAFRKRFGNDDYALFFGIPHRGKWVSREQTFQDGRQLYKYETLPPDTQINEWGVGHSKGSAAAMHMSRMHHPLKGIQSIEEVQSYPFPRVNDSTLNGLRAWVDGVHAQGLAAVGAMACTIWETAWYMRSMEELMMDMMTGDEKATLLFDKITDIHCRLAAQYAAAGVDILHGGDDIGTQSAPMMSVELWREWIKPRWKKVIDAARKQKPDILVYYHSCGYVLPFIEELIEIGVDILNPVQPESMDFNEVHDRFGDRLSFWGTIGTQTTLPFGTPDDVKRTVLSRLAKCGKKGGIVIGPTHLVEPEVPWENLMALVDTAKAYGN